MLIDIDNDGDLKLTQQRLMMAYFGWLSCNHLFQVVPYIAFRTNCDTEWGSQNN